MKQPNISCYILLINHLRYFSIYYKTHQATSLWKYYGFIKTPINKGFQKNLKLLVLPMGKLILISFFIEKRN